MLSRAPERGMRIVRSLLLLAWFVLFLSLLWDPVSAALTSPDNLASPFHVRDGVVMVQGNALSSAPYPMGARIFWTMVLPCVPMFLMLFGHETWRRVCPLSHISQIPRMLGRQRRIKTLNRSSGRVERLLALVPSQSWLGRNHLYFQFGFLAIGVLGRLLFYNSDRLALAVAFAVMWGAALTVGLLYGGKTWCNYFCPVGVIQAIYTGPGGLLDSKAHIAPNAVAQSVCRVPGPGGDRSACVGCRPACPDVDLENAYWKTVESDRTQFMYYGFFGLVLAFYTYYLAYSGGWAYYMSGIWTHEAGQIDKLLAPGFYAGGVAVPIPKLIAAPLYFTICIAASYWLFLFAERLYARVRAWRGESMSRARLRHHMLTVCAFLTFNLFYVFAGRPNILLMPGWASKLIDMGIVAASMGWLVRALWRDADMYRRERMARTLREQLTRMGFRSEDALEGRPIELLSADEVYVLAKTLPNFSAQRKRELYRAILTEALETGEIQSAESLKILSDLRAQLGLSEAEHHAIVDVLGIHNPSLLDPQMARSVELQMRHENYRKFLLSLVQHARATGIRADEYLADAEGLQAAEPARALFNISDDDHARIAAEVARDETASTEHVLLVLGALRELETARFSLRLDERPEARLLRHGLLLKQRVVIREIVSLLASIDDPRRRRPFAQSLRALVGSDAETALADAVHAVAHDVREATLDMTDDPAPISYLDVIEAAAAADAVIRALAEDRDPAIAAVAISALAGSDPAYAESMAEELSDRTGRSPLMDDVLACARCSMHSELVQIMVDLLKVNVFAALELNTLAEIARRSDLIRFRVGEEIFRAGESAGAMFVLTAGEAEVHVAAGDELRVVRGLQQGAVFGELGVFTGRPRSATIAVTSATATALAIPRDVIEECLGHDAHALRGMLDRVSGYLLDTLAAARTPRERARAEQSETAA
ncbi:MAG: cyclic nucleotide-binding domain-containing protein [Acetobacteraceae bacterium]|nr:cyclic nucleotide-binding domain-containing protein [Acetobacteraceae bacterium]